MRSVWQGSTTDMIAQTQLLKGARDMRFTVVSLM
jgi:hypothetical protein